MTFSLIFWYFVVSTGDEHDDYDEEHNDDDDDDNDNDNDVDDDVHQPWIPHASTPPARLPLWQDMMKSDKSG